MCLFQYLILLINIISENLRVPDFNLYFCLPGGVDIYSRTSVLGLILVLGDSVFTKCSKLKNIFYIKEGFHFSGGRGVNQNFRKIFSIKGGRRGVLLLLTVTCSVIPDILSSTSFKLQTSPSSSASLRLLLMNLTNNR